MADKKVKYSIEAQDKTKQGIDNSIKNLLGIDDAMRKVGKGITDAFKITAIVAGVQQLAKAAFEAVEAFGEMERGQIALQSAFQGNGEAVERMNGLIDDLSDKTLASKQEVMNMVTQLASLGRSESDIKKISTAATYLSNVTGQGLNEAMKQVNATFSGSTDELGKLLPELKGLSKEQLAAGGATDVIMQKLGALSDQLAGGVSQKIKNMKDSWADLKVELGRNLAEVFSPLIGWIDKLAASWTKNLETARIYKEVQDSIKAGTDPSAIDPSKQMVFLEESLRRAEALRRGVLGGMTGGALTPEQYSMASGGDISIENAKKFFDILATNPEVAKLDTEIRSLRDQITWLGMNIRGQAEASKAGASGASGGTTPAASPYAEAFGTFMARMKESAAQWTAYNEMMLAEMEPEKIQAEMVKRFAVTSPSSPSAADWARLNANNAAGTTGVPDLYSGLLQSIFADPAKIKKDQDDARDAAQKAEAQAEEQKRIAKELDDYMKASQAKYRQQMALLMADKSTYEDLYVQLEIEKENAILEATEAGLTDTLDIEAYYAERRRQLDEEVAAKRLEDEKRHQDELQAVLTKARRDAIAAAQADGLSDLGQNDVGFDVYNVIKEAGAGLFSSGLSASGTAGGGLGGMLQSAGGSALSGLGGLLGSLAGPIGSIVGMISSLGPVMQIMQPMGVILQGIMQVLSPIINDLLKPLLGILTIIGRVIGGLLSPALLILKPIIEAVSIMFVWLYNNVVVPIYNGIMWVFNQIYNGFAAFINGILWLIDQIPFVDVGRVAYRDANAGFLEAIDLADLSEAGDSVSGTSSAAGSAQYTQGRSITMNFYENGVVVGDGGIRQLAVLLRNELMDLESLAQ